MSEQSKKTIETPENEPRPSLVSHHVFLLPFKWTKKRGGEEVLLDIHQFQDLSRALIDSKKWENEPFTIDKIANYNEWHYFYEYVREVLYETADEQPEKQFIKHFRHKEAAGGKYVITTPKPWSQRESERKKDDGSQDINYRKTYTLDIDEVYLHLYYTGVGVLSFHLENRRQDQNKPDDILYINQYGRRVFPPFYPIPAEKVGRSDAFSHHFGDIGDIKDQPQWHPNGKEVAYSIKIEMGQNSKSGATEDWSNLLRNLQEHKGIVSEKAKSKHAIPELVEAAFVAPFLKHIRQREYGLKSVLDDRMFVVCWYGDDKQSNKLNPKQVWDNKQRLSGRTIKYRRHPSSNEKQQAIFSSDWWYKFVFVDAAMVTVQEAEMRQSLIKKASYLRWAGYGTFYGVTDYSLVLLSSSLPSLKEENAEFLVTHLQSIYYKLAELTLVQRACVQHFSDEVTHVSSFPKEREAQLAKQASLLYKRYIRFVNRIYFREVTAQVQGIELYEMLQKQSRLRDAVESLNDEVEELNAFVKQINDDRQAEGLNALAVIGAVIAGPSLFLSLLGAHGLPGESVACQQKVYFWSVWLCIGIAMLSWILYYCYQRFTPNTKDKWWKIPLLLVIAGLLIASIFLPPNHLAKKSPCYSDDGNKVEQLESSPFLQEMRDESNVAPLDSTISNSQNLQNQ
ncbi:MAG: hypothetical protein AAGF87_10475 [Bacteroidota bacterium]